MSEQPEPKPSDSRSNGKLASTLVLFGMALFAVERFGLKKLEGPNHLVHLDQTLFSIIVLAPVAFVVAGILVFLFGGRARKS